MKTILMSALALVLLVFAPVRANDGVFYAQGNNLIPLQETRIELRKEVLKFFVRDFGFVEVDVDFEFFNPDGERKLTVGFVTPPAMGDLEEGEFGHPRISDFTVVVNGEPLEHKIAKMEDTSFNAESLDVNGFDYVYHFEVTFKPGMNRIRHTYRFKGGATVETQRDFDYQITTGKRWANKQIDDFELQLHLDEGIFNLPARFVKGTGLADWKIVGDGVLKPKAEKFYEFDEESIRMVHLNKGYIVFKAMGFRPDYDIKITEFNWAAGWLRKMCASGKECVSEKEIERIGHLLSISPGDYIGKEDLKDLTRAELKRIRNYGFALRGYDFISPDLKKFYAKFFWYKPDPALKAEDVELSDAEKVFIEKVRAAEKAAAR